MLKVEITDSSGACRVLEVGDDCTIGKNADADIRLDSWRLGKEHARLFKTPAGMLIEDLGAFAGVSVNGTRIDALHGPLFDDDIISIGQFKLRVLIPALEKKNVPETISDVDNAVLEQLDGPQGAKSLQGSAGQKLQQAGIKQINSENTPSPSLDATSPSTAGNSLALVAWVHPLQQEMEFEWRKKIHTKLLETMDLRRHDVSQMSDEVLRNQTSILLNQILRELDAEIPPQLNRAVLCKQVLNEAVGLGPLEELLEDESVTEIMVNRFDEIYVERDGRLQKHPMTFTGDRAVLGVIERIVAPLGRRIDESSPMVDARLKDGSRVNAIIPPLALRGAALTIRKFAQKKLNAQDLVGFNAISPDMAKFLKICVEARKNIVVSGGTGSGKTTLLNILSNFIPVHERVITVEDAAELKLDHDHLVSLESRPANVEGKGAILIRDLVKNTLRMRPDRIVVGECRGAEALDMLQAMNTGHEGSLTTLHANTPRDGLARLETMVLMAGMDLPLVAIREQIASAVDIVVQQTRFACGSRKVTSITELTGMESGKIQIQEIFKFVNKGYGKTGNHNANKVQGYFSGCDTVPSFYEELQAVGGGLDMRIFKPHELEDRSDEFSLSDERAALNMSGEIR